MIVVDASLALSWFFEGESDALSKSSARRVLTESAVVPPVFASEVANALHFAAKRGRITDEDVRNALDRLSKLPIRIDATRLALHDELRLAKAHDLTVYDASYLALAQRLRVPLLTRDADLLRAINAERPS